MEAVTQPAMTDRNEDGSPKWTSYEHFIEAVIEWKVREVLSKLFPVALGSLN